MPGWVRGAIVGSAVSVFVSTAHGETRSSASEERHPVVLAVSTCAKAPLSDLQRIVGAELGINVAAQPETDAPGPAAPADTNATLVSISCAGQWIRLEVLDPVSGKTLVRHLNLPPSDPSTRTRMLGLSVAELIAASWIELAARPAARPHIVEAKASQSTKDSALTAAQKALAPPSFSRLEGVAAFQRTGNMDLMTTGGGIGASWVRHGWLVFGGDLLVEGGSKDVALGSIRALLVSGSALVRVRHQLGWLAVEGGIGARLGLAHMQGVAAEITPRPETDDATLPWWGPMIAVRAEASLVQRLVLVVGLEAGRVVRAAEGRSASQAALSIENGWVGLMVGPALTLGD